MKREECVFVDSLPSSVRKREDVRWKTLSQWVQSVWYFFENSISWTVREVLLPNCANWYRTFDCPQRTHLKILVEEIKNSPLLTDEDLQVLNSAIPTPTNIYTHLTDDHAHPLKHYGFFWAFSLLLPTVVAMGWWLHPVILIMGVALPLFFFMTRLFSYWSDKLLSELQILRIDYYSAMDKMLTQLTASLRWLQEVELASRGLTRPLPSLPARRLACGHAHKLLQKRILGTCSDVIASLRTSTRELCRSHDLAPELEDRGSYLAFTPIHTLHQYMREEGTGAGMGGALIVDGDDDVEMRSLSLDSIKVTYYACHLANDLRYEHFTKDGSSHLEGAVGQVRGYTGLGEGFTMLQLQQMLS